MDDLALLRPQLNRLKLTGLLESLDERLRQAIHSKWSYSRFLSILFSDEIERRNNKQLLRRLSKSGLDPSKTFETFDFGFNNNISETTLRELGSCQFIKNMENILLLGPSGVGKSHIAQAIGHEACRLGIEVAFGRTHKLLKWIWAGKGDGTHERRIKQTIKVPLLILDDFGLEALTQDQQNDLYEIICERYEKFSTIVTSNRDFVEWTNVFENPLMASAAMDRLIHRASKITITGKSFRTEAFLKRNKNLTNATKKG